MRNMDDLPRNPPEGDVPPPTQRVREWPSLHDTRDGIAPAPAEACTEVGQEDTDEEEPPWNITDVLIILAVVALSLLTLYLIR